MELLYGTRQMGASGYSAINLEDCTDITLDNVSVAYSLFEVPLRTAIALLPSGIHPSVPSLGVVTFWSVPGGPLGPFEFASVGISCRTGIKPRHLVCSAFIDSERAGAALSRRFGYVFQPARVKLREYYDRIAGSVVLADRTVLQIDTTGMVPLVGAGSFVKFSPALNAVRCAEQIKMVQVEASYEFVRVIRGASNAQVFDSAALGDLDLRPGFPVSGAFAIVNLTLHSAKFLVSATVPAEAGGVMRIARSDAAASSA